MFTLENDINDDIIERQRILENVKTLPSRYSFNDLDKQLFRNYSVLIIYSIWEGFVQQSFQSYVRELNKLELLKSEVNDKVLTFSIENTFKQLREYPSKENKKTKYFNDLASFFQQEKIEIPVTINTESNVGFKVINQLLDNFNLEKLPDYIRPQYSFSIELKFFIDQHRNPIAHGNAGAISVTPEEINRFIGLVTKLMDEVYERMINGFRSKTYLKEAFR